MHDRRHSHRAHSTKHVPLIVSLDENGTRYAMREQTPFERPIAVFSKRIFTLNPKKSHFSPEKWPKMAKSRWQYHSRIIFSRNFGRPPRFCYKKVHFCVSTFSLVKVSKRMHPHTNVLDHEHSHSIALNGDFRENKLTTSLGQSILFRISQKIPSFSIERRRNRVHLVPLYLCVNPCNDVQ